MITRLRWLADSLSGFLWLLALLSLLFYLYVYVHYAGALLNFPFDYDQGEGYDVYSGILLSQGRWIYNDNSVYPFYSSNYPPLYSLLVALAVRVFGPDLLAGRVVSVIASFLLGLLIYAIVRRGAQGRATGLIAVAAFFASTYVYHVTPLARVNASMALLALMGVYCVGKLGWRWLALGTFFLLTAVYTKQTAVDAMAAALVYLLIYRWRRAVVVGAALALVGGVTFLVLDRSSGGQFYVNAIQANLNPYEWQQTAAYYANFVGLHAVVLGLSLVAIVVSVCRRAPSIYHIYALTALGVAAAVGKWGAGESYFLNSVVAICIVAGMALGRLRSRLPCWVRPAVPLLILIQMALFWHGPFEASGLGLEDRGFQGQVLGRPPTSLDAANGWRIMTYVARSGGDVLLEESGFALVDHRAIVGNASQLFNLSQSGQWDDQELVQRLDQKRFDLVILKAQFYPPSVLEAIRRNYGTAAVLEMVGRPYRIMVPQPTGLPLPATVQTTEPPSDLSASPVEATEAENSGSGADEPNPVVPALSGAGVSVTATPTVVSGLESTDGDLPIQEPSDNAPAVEPETQSGD